MSPYLFNFYTEIVIRETLNDLNMGIRIVGQIVGLSSETENYVRLLNPGFKGIKKESENAELHP